MREITLKYVGETTTEDTITVHDVDFIRTEVLWGEESKSITGKVRNNHRGFQAELIITFRQMTDLEHVAQNIYNAVMNNKQIMYTSEQGTVQLVPEQFTSISEYKFLNRRTSTLRLLSYIELSFFVIRCGFTDVFCGQQNIGCGGYEFTS